MLNDRNKEQPLQGDVLSLWRCSGWEGRTWAVVGISYRLQCKEFAGTSFWTMEVHPLLSSWPKVCILWSRHHCQSPGMSGSSLDLSVLLQHAVPGHFRAERADLAVLCSLLKRLPYSDSSATCLLKTWLLQLNPRCLVWRFFCCLQQSSWSTFLQAM